MAAIVGDEATAEKVMNAIIKDNPAFADTDALDANASKGGRASASGRGGNSTKAKVDKNIRLSSYMEARGTKRSNDDITRDTRMDKQLFFTRCAKDRPNWNPARVEKEWNGAVEDCPEEDRKYNGPSEEPMRVFIPGWIFGEDAREARTSNYSDKHMLTSTKPTAMSTVAIGDAVKDCSKGHTVAAANSNAALEQAGRESITYKADEQAEKAAMEAMALAAAAIDNTSSAPTSQVDAAGAPANGSANVPSSGTSVDGSAGVGKETKKKNIQITRVQAVNSEKLKVEKVERSLQATCKDMAFVMDAMSKAPQEVVDESAATLALATGAYKLLLRLLGREPVCKGGDRNVVHYLVNEGMGQATDFDEHLRAAKSLFVKNHGEGAALPSYLSDPQEFQTRHLKEICSSAALHEGPTMVDIRACKVELCRISTLSSFAEIEVSQENLERHRDALKAFEKSSKEVLKEVKKLVPKDTDKKGAAEQAVATTGQPATAEDLRAQLAVAGTGQRPIMTVNWGALNVGKPMRVMAFLKAEKHEYADVSAWLERLTTPWVANVTKHEVYFNKSGKEDVVGWAESFAIKFIKPAEKKHGIISLPIKSDHGVGIVKSMIDFLLPEDRTASIKSLCKASVLPPPRGCS